MENSILLKKKRKKNLIINSLKIGCLSLFMVLQSCSIQLAPRYDQNIIDNLTSSTDDVYSLFAEISNGTKPSDYSKREDKHNSIIGKFESLKQQIDARPTPDNKKVDKIIKEANKHLEKKENKILIPSQLENPTSKAMEEIIKNLLKLKEVDKLQGVTKEEVNAFKGNIVLYLDQALTYEKFLNP